MTAVFATACAKTPQEEARVEILEGASQSVTIVGGIGASAGLTSLVDGGRHLHLRCSPDRVPRAA
jgi:hypothetical protein